MDSQKLVDSVIDSKDGVFAAWKARLEHPILGAFVLYWAIWNYHVLVVLFSDATFQAKLGYLHRTFHLDTFWGRICSAFWPLVFAVMTPYFEVLLAAIWRTIDTAKKRFGGFYDPRDLATPSQVREIRAEYEAQLIEKEKQLEQLRATHASSFNASQHMQFYAGAHAYRRFDAEGEIALERMHAGQFKVPSFTTSVRSAGEPHLRVSRLIEMLESKGLSPEHLKTIGLLSEVPMAYSTYIESLGRNGDPHASEPFAAMLVWTGAIRIDYENLTEPSFTLSSEGLALKAALDHDPEVKAWRELGRGLA